MLTWKVEAEGDTVYVQAENIEQAKARFEKSFGGIPEDLVKWTQIDALPKGEEAIAR